MPGEEHIQADPEGRSESQFVERLIFWLLFELGFALLPVMFSLMGLGPHTKALIERGDLILIGVVITGAATGTSAQVRASARVRRNLRAVLMGAGCLAAVLGTAAYAKAEPARLAFDIAASALVPIAGISLGIGALYLVDMEEQARGPAGS